MKLTLIPSLLLSSLSLLIAEPAPKVYNVRPVEALPDGAGAWEQSGFLKDQREGRFQPYDAEAAAQLVLDATAERGAVGKNEGVPRRTFFRAAYDARGIGFLIEAEEPLIQKLQDDLLDPASSAQHETLEIFFTPALTEAPYYQIFVNLAKGGAEFFDWGSPHRRYRSLKGVASVERRIGQRGYIVSVFIPWEAIYEHLPLEGGEWRFSIVRWMPFAKAGGVTWGGKVHETGRFGRLKLEKPNEALRQAMQARLARYAWFHYTAQSKIATRAWSDEKMGDPAFYATRLLPVFQEYSRLGESLGAPEQWSEKEVLKITPVLKEWLEVSYKIQELRADYLIQQRFSEID